MDKTQAFIKDNLLVKNFNNPDKPIDEKRLQDTLLILPTDGGLTSKLRRSRTKLRLNTDNIESYNKTKHPRYRTVTKSSKVAFKNYINNCRRAVSQTKKLILENNISDRATLEGYLQSNNKTDLMERLPNYEKVKPMHEKLWINYMKEVLGIPESVRDSSKLSINGTSALLKLSMADYNGSLLKVSNSRNRNLVGIQGIVIWDSQKSFIMCTRGSIYDELKIIPKKGTVFSFEVPINDESALQYSILGDRFKYRSSDRAGRKFKSRRCDDMLYYIS
ncbi:hypothetical protein KAFR_0A00900 [Kazachstania africana CBS 2517]|uniref:Ribonuclease P protein subunit n=1 Tax=Kazachstania africana (strain ATCC 22294 / BCRC 22015 / CBS 2517 / CECT 1963 / NBRC 1671 / NRRL Y-8276) TaxID=1071382 RepID=H2AMC8_KAZAF|nr:hypothetical protein KAFR_0A00900 [Kazachstania africana CBS 2517]CCF55528.1 hypothetical protein KAFR_0A00900 [Kazachstania africana CBS 2517]